MKNLEIKVGLESYAVDALPDFCPHCNYAVDPLFLNSRITGDRYASDTKIDVAYACVRNSCYRIFVASYWSRGYQRTATPFYLGRITPKSYKQPVIPEEVSNVSSRFLEIYNQAYSAEMDGFHELCGMGYRKALEFLLKDYCIAKDPGNRDDIESLLLGKVIKKYVEDPRIKSCADRAAWLGNDETHYVRRWNDKDVGDLKILLELTINWIRSEILTEQYTTSMGSGKSG